VFIQNIAQGEKINISGAVKDQT